MSSPEISHDARRRQFATPTPAGPAVLDYRLDGDRIVFTHTGVPREAEGQGIGSALVRAGLTHAREAGLTVVPQCPFVAAYLQRHPDEADLAGARDAEA